MRPKVLGVFMLIAVAAVAQQPFVYHDPRMSEVVARRDLVYASPGGTALRFDLYRLPGEARLPVVVFFNGIGSFDLKDWDIYQNWSRAAAAGGLAAITHQTRSGTEAADFDALVAHLREHQDEYGVDAGRIAVWSASANVRAGLPMVQDPARAFVKAAVVYYGTADVSEWRLDLPILFVRAGLDRPFLNAQLDQNIADAITHNVPLTVINHAGGNHPFEINDDGEASRRTIGETIEFMRESMTDAMQAAIAGSLVQATAASASLRNDWPAAIGAYEVLVERMPESAETWRAYGQALSGAGRHENALRALDRAWDLGHRGYRDVGVPAARSAAALGNIDRTLVWLERTLHPFQDTDWIRKDMAFDKFKGDRRFEALLGAADDFRAFAEILGREGTEEGLAFYEEAQTKAPHPLLDHPFLLNRLGYQLLGKGKSEESIAVLRLVVAKNSTSANAHDSLAEAYRAVGDRTRAADHARRAIELAASTEIAAAQRDSIVANAQSTLAWAEGPVP